ncbi:MAG: UpxY family transcription antiterminator [Saprospiraceae bacterium]|nr:UpxY family transcription antiterminator [Saprospiraceae bacterium]
MKGVSVKSSPEMYELHPSEARWFAVHTRSKSEKMVKRLLEKKQVEAYVPVQKHLRKYQRIKRWVELPLFNCYVFVRITQPQYVQVLETQHVVDFVRFGKTMIAIPESEIDTIRRITLENGLDIVATPGHFAEGDPVEISAGGLTGLKGLIVRQEGKRKFQVILNHFGMSLLISIDAAFLEKTGRNT